MPSHPELTVESHEGGIRTLRLSRPERRNALSPSLIEALSSALDDADRDDVRVLRLEGAPDGAFCSGYDLDALTRFRDDPPGGVGGAALPDEPLASLFERLERLRAPSVALVTGAAIGAGCELASACDFRIASPQASFCMPPARLGIIYAPDGIARLVRLVGFARAKRMFLTAAQISAETALEWGLVDTLEPNAAAARARADELCASLTEGAPLALSGMKDIFADLSEPRFDAGSKDSMRARRREAFLSRDTGEGIAAVLSKRKAHFEGE